MGKGVILYDTDEGEVPWRTDDTVAETPCPICQVTTTLDINVGTLAYLAYDYFHEVLDSAEASRLSAVFATALTHSAVMIRIPATEEMVDQFEEFVEGARP
jgi:hypothetical protein